MKPQQPQQRMNCFDRLKIVANSADYIDNIDEHRFKSTCAKGSITNYSYSNYSKRDKPAYELYIEKDIADNETVIEFTGKILGSRYPELINKTNIRQCLENINALGLCSIDIDAILAYGEVVKADKTVDVEHQDVKLLKDEINACIKNHTKDVVKVKGRNIIVEHDRNDKRRKRRLTLYDKEKEMGLSKNKRWLNSLGSDAAKQLTEHFKGKVRFELNLYTKQAIRDELNIHDTSLSSVLNSDAKPIMHFLDKILMDNNKARQPKNLRDLERLALIEKYHKDITQVESLVNALKGKKTNLSQAMKPYRELYFGIGKNPSETASLKQRLRGMLLEIFLVGFLFVV